MIKGGGGNKRCGTVTSRAGLMGSGPSLSMDNSGGSGSL